MFVDFLDLETDFSSCLSFLTLKIFFFVDFSFELLFEEILERFETVVIVFL